jgi:cytochrome c oxidase subunit 2
MTAHSMFNAAGPQSARIEQLWWLLFWVLTVVYILVIGWFLVALLRKHRSAERVTDDGDVGRQPMRVVTAATVATVLILFALLAIDVWGGRGLTAATDHAAVTIDVVGHQWWWEIQYVDQNPSQTAVAANEIHIPVGRPVVIRTRSADVIHSFWVPSLHGKRDLIPGYQTAIWMQADREGVYRGQCAEFCGLQHARMALQVVAEKQDAFERWLASLRQPAAEPKTPEEQRGQQVFLSGPCVMCHTISGTSAGARLGPDLTHVGSRWTIAAGVLPNTRGHLAGWIADSQAVKPGNRMPPIALRGDELQPLLTYLQSLK